MPSICFYFQVHQPERLRRYSVFDSSHDFFDDAENQRILRKVAHKCYLPANDLMLELVKRHNGKFRCAFSVTGVVLDQFRQFHPSVVDSFRALADSGGVEFLNETYFHSLCFLYSREEWREQVEMHQKAMIRELGVTPRTFRNTELIYGNEVAIAAAELGREVVLCDGPPATLTPYDSTQIFTPPDLPGIRLLIKNAGLSDDIAFRFSDRNWPGWPLTADRFAKWAYEAAGETGVINLFIDYETFGEHQWAETGIFEFLEWLPTEWLKLKGAKFETPIEAATSRVPIAEYDLPHMTSWADTDRDLSAWLGNPMQANALHELYALEPVVKKQGDPELLKIWRKLQVSDHFYYMSTKSHTDGIVHHYFNPHDSPYDAFINFMNVLDQFRNMLK
ncbi:MAG: glycoside hydrolase family 57 protein [Phycisphaerae bacterium]